MKKSKMKKGGAYIKNNDLDNVLRRLYADLEELKNSGLNLLEKQIMNTSPNIKSKIYFNAVISMIANANMIVYIRREDKEDLEDVSGFFFYINSSKSYFKRMNENGMEEDVYNLLLKIELIGVGNQKYYTFNDEHKRYVKPDTVYNETLIQQQIYNVSSVTTYQMCPSVFDVSIFKSDAACEALFSLMEDKLTLMEDKLEDNYTGEVAYTREVINFLSEEKKNNRAVKGISMISMEFAEKFQLFYNFLNDDYNSLIKSEYGKDKVYEIFAYIYSLLLSLYIITGIFSKSFTVDDCMIKEDIVNKPLKNNVYIFDLEEFEITNSNNQQTELVAEPQEHAETQEELSMTNINQRYVSFFESTNPDSPIQYDLVMDFFDKYYPSLNNMKLPRRSDGIYALNDMHNSLFKNYFLGFIKDMLRNINPETIEQLKITDENKLIIDSYNVNIVTTNERAATTIQRRTRERRDFRRQVQEQQEDLMDELDLAPAAGGRRRTMKTRRRKLSKKKKSKTKSKRKRN